MYVIMSNLFIFTFFNIVILVRFVRIKKKIFYLFKNFEKINNTLIGIFLGVINIMIV